MSAKLKIGFITSSLFCLGWASAWSVHALNSSSQKDHQLRTIASVQEKSTIAMEKHLLPVHVEIIAPEELPEGPNELVTLKGQLRAAFPGFSQMSYSWILPNDVEIVKGHIADVIVNPVADQTYEVEITLRNFDKQYRKELTLKATAVNKAGENLVNTSIITSRPEDSMEHLAPLMMVKAQELNNLNRAPASADSQE